MGATEFEAVDEDRPFFDLLHEPIEVHSPPEHAADRRPASIQAGLTAASGPGVVRAGFLQGAGRVEEDVGEGVASGQQGAKG